MSERKVATDALETLGTIIGPEQKRDAIHLAVEPVVAGEHLVPGQHIVVEGGTAFAAAIGQGLGIVDPFLQIEVEKGDRFWFVMYPRAVHSLRHVWTHPAFADEATTPSRDRAASEAWLRNYCATADCPSYELIMEAIDKGTSRDCDREISITYGTEYISVVGIDAYGEIPAEFFDHAEIVLGRRLPHRPQYFTCSC